jgi:hypothetical protein
MNEIAESDWFKAGAYWMALGSFAIVPPFARTPIGALARALFEITLVIHGAEAIYCLGLTARTGMDRRRWFWRTIVLGYLAIRRLHALSQPPPPAVTHDSGGAA